MNKNLKSAGAAHSKIDSIALACGNEKFTDDFHPSNPLHISFLYSDVPFGTIRKLDVSEAEALEGVAAVYHYGNTPDVLHTTAGQGFPEPSPYDCLMFDKIVRFTGDRIAAVAAESKSIADKAAGLIKVDIEEHPPVFDPEESMASSSAVLHCGGEHVVMPVAYRPEENLAAEVLINFGDLNEGFSKADEVIEESYSMQYASHCATEPHAVSVHFDERGRLVIISATQVPFHLRRIVSMVCGIEIKNIRVIKPRVGGGFGGKQEVFLEQVCRPCRLAAETFCKDSSFPKRSLYFSKNPSCYEKPYKKWVSKKTAR